MNGSINDDLFAILSDRKRIAGLIIAFVILVLVYVFQDLFSLAAIVGPNRVHPYVDFAFKKAVRIILNDTAMLLMIHAWFYNSKITYVALIIELIDLLILFPIYLTAKLSIEGESEFSAPLLSQFHRLIVNPILMLILIPAVYVQRSKDR